MSEVICPNCNAVSPEYAKYCAHCGQPVICNNCGAPILPTARACIQCGRMIPERQNSAIQLGSNANVLPGYNHLELHRRTDATSYDLNFTFSDVIGQGQGNLISDMISEGFQVTQISHNDNQHASTDVVEIGDANQVALQLPSSTESSQGNIAHIAKSPNDMIRTSLEQIFQLSGEKIRLVVRDLKADTQQEYTYRLVHLILYAYQELLNITNVPRGDVLELTGYAGLVQKNVQAYMSRDDTRTKRDGEYWSLRLPGVEHARAVALEVVDPSGAGSYMPANSTKTPATTMKKSRKKPEISPAAADKIGQYVSNPATQELIASIPHEAFKGLSTTDRALIALYGLRRSGHTGEIMPMEIEQYLYSAFHVPANNETIRSALKQSLARGNMRLVHRDHGYHITPSGEKYVGELRARFTQSDSQVKPASLFESPESTEPEALERQTDADLPGVEE